MNNLIKIAAAIIVLCAGHFRAGAEEWTYTGSYPYVYAPSSDTWYYLPDSPPLVWDYSADEWVTNPFGGRAFNIKDLASLSEIALTLKIDEQDSIFVILNYPDSMTGTYECGSISSAINIGLKVDESNGTMLVFGALVGDAASTVGAAYGDSDWPNSFTLLLKFDTANAGTFTYFGIFDPSLLTILGYPSSGIFAFTGAFSAEYPE